MTNAALALDVDLETDWWNSPEYAEGELYIPGQRQLEPDEQEVLEKIAKETHDQKVEIPPMPKASLEASELLRDPEIEMEDLATCIEQDPAMTAALIRYVNSGFFGARFPVDTVIHDFSTHFYSARC